MRGLMTAALAAISLTGCASSGTEVKPEQLSQLQRGKTTIVQVEQTLGQPNADTLGADGAHRIAYVYVHSQARAASFIPLVGPLVGGADAHGTTVVLTFDKTGVLTDYTSTATNVGVGMGAAGS